MKRIVSTIVLTVAAFAAVSCIAPDPPQSGERGLEARTVFVATDRHDVGQGNNLKALVQMASQNRSVQAPSIYVIGGDNAGKGSMRDSLAMPVYSLDEVWSEIEAGAGTDDFTFLATFGSHDGGCTDGYQRFFSGPRHCNGLYIYGVSYAQMCFAADTSAAGYTALDAYDSFGVSAEAASAKFLRWVSTLDDADPIIVMSHMPIHAHRRDNPGGKIWADALNQASEEHDIILLFGHNHTSEETGAKPAGPVDPSPGTEGDPGGDMETAEDPKAIEQSCYLVLPGGRLPVQTADMAIADTMTIRFTYMNAGYIKLGYASTISFSDEDRDGTFDSIGLRRITVNDTTVTQFGTTAIPNPCILDSGTSWHHSPRTLHR